jgi:trehalose 6-phosphate phosphatase
LSESGAVDEELRVALTILAAEPRVLVAVDFDGTLAPFVTDPMRARSIAGGVEALRAAAALDGCTVAVVSGRDVATLEVVTGIRAGEGITLVGSHGAEVRLAEAAESTTSADAVPLDDAAAHLLDTVRQELEAIAGRYAGVRLEHKPSAVVLHTREVDARTAQAATEAALDVGRRLTGVTVIPGKAVVELSVSAADKGTALVRLAQGSRSNATLYVGDDTTDERAFAALQPSEGDLTVKVGAGETLARFRVADPEAVVALLELFVDRRTVSSRLVRRHPADRRRGRR